jgi:WhiB family redox-sensing transcriptional regulator
MRHRTPVSDPVRDHRWRDYATCRLSDSRLFFDRDHESFIQREGREATAMAVCAACPAQRECLDYALAIPEKFGVWGGTTAEERVVLRRGAELSRKPATRGAPERQSLQRRSGRSVPGRTSPRQIPPLPASTPRSHRLAGKPGAGRNPR